MKSKRLATILIPCILMLSSCGDENAGTEDTLTTPDASGLGGIAGMGGTAGLGGIAADDGMAGGSGQAGDDERPGQGGDSGLGGNAGAAGVDGQAGNAGHSNMGGEAGGNGLAGASGNGGDSGTGGIAGMGGIAGSAGSSGQTGMGGMAGQPETRVAMGAVIISEILYDPHSGLDDDSAEWIELHNTTDEDIVLNGCFVVDEVHLDPLQDQAVLDGMTITSGGFLLLGRSNDPAVNGGLNMDALFDFGLSNGGDIIVLSCAGMVVDRVAYDDGNTYPNARQASIARSQDTLLGPDSDAVRWCLGQAVYLADPEHRGTPGAANPLCPELMPGECQANADCAENERCNVDTCEEVIVPDCTNDMECEGDLVCRDGACIAGPMGMMGNPMAGELLVTEIMYNPHNGLSDNNAEWIEVHNASNRDIVLDGCDIADEGAATGSTGSPVELNGPLNAGEYLVVARSADPAVNGGLMPFATFGFALRNSGDTVHVRCGGETLDAVTYGGAAGFPIGEAISVQRSQDAMVGPHQEDTPWCLSTDIYLADPEHRGTPGTANTVCAP